MSVLESTCSTLSAQSATTAISLRTENVWSLCFPMEMSLLLSEPFFVLFVCVLLFCQCATSGEASSFVTKTSRRFVMVAAV